MADITITEYSGLANIGGDADQQRFTKIQAALWPAVNTTVVVVASPGGTGSHTCAATTRLVRIKVENAAATEVNMAVQGTAADANDEPFEDGDVFWRGFESGGQEIQIFVA